MPKKTKFDPTGQSRNRSQASKAIKNRLLKARKRVKSLFATIPNAKKTSPIVRNNEEVSYEYMLIPGAAIALQQSITEIVESELETTEDTQPLGWFYSEYAEQPYRNGAAEQVIQSNQQIDEATIIGALALLFYRKLLPEEYLRSTPYYTAVQQVFTRNFNLVSTMSSELSIRSASVMFDAISAGVRPADVLAQLDATFDRADARAVRIADTEVNRAYNDARIETAQHIAQQVGLTSGVQHISALIPTTRPHHAARHLKYYSVEAQQQWWAEGANRINCHCSANPVLLGEDGQPLNRESDD